jgi:hypothetical protein
VKNLLEYHQRHNSEVTKFVVINIQKAMYEPVQFKRLKEIASELNHKLEQLQLGLLSREELESLTDSSRDLYERLVVLRFKAYDEEVKPKAVETKLVEEEKPVVQSFSFKIEEPRNEVATPNQVSLIDAIEEVSKSGNTILDEKPATLDTKADNDDQVTEKIIPSEVRPVVTSPVANSFKAPESLHEKLTRSASAPTSLAEKLEHLPISDLKKAITLNQRFQFSKELFKGDNQEYEKAIEKLNTSSREDALKHLDSLKSTYSWTDGSVVATDFIDLIERRHA